MKLHNTGIKALAFDAYGTLFNVHAAVLAHANAIGSDAQALSDVWRAKQLEYSWIRTLAGQWKDFWAVTEDALDFALAKYPHIDPAHRSVLLRSYETLHAYDEALEVLTALKAQSFRLGLLSNGSRPMLASAVAAAGFASLFDGVWSADEVRQFKTTQSVYDLARDGFALDAQAICLVSSNRWDVAGARAYGMQAIWVNRTRQPDEYRDLAPRAVISDLRDLLH